MGKADNIKRMRKLKEAKRCREKVLLIPEVENMALSAIEIRAKKRGDDIKRNIGPIKYSVLFKEFLAPMLEAGDDVEMLKLKMLFASQAWNGASVRKKSEEKFREISEKMASLLDEQKRGELLFAMMAERKEQLFSAHKVLIMDFEVLSFFNNEFEIAVATLPIDL